MRPTLPQLANELLDEVISYLPTLSDQLSVLHTCRGLHWPAARRMYRHVSVSDYKARRLFKTIAESDLGYQHFVRTLKFSATSNTDIRLNYILLRDAIPKLYNLQYLSLSIQPTLSTFLIYLLRKSNLAQSFDKLDRLCGFSLHGDIRLIKLFQYQNIRKVELTEPMNDRDFAYVVNTLVFPETTSNPIITDLTLTFNRPDRRLLLYAIIRIGECFPNIRRLVIRGLQLNALDISLLFTMNPPLLPHLEQLEVNRLSVVASFESPLVEDKSLAIEHIHIVEAGRLRSGLRQVSFGMMIWSRVPLTNDWNVLARYSNKEDDPDTMPQCFDGHPQEWVLEYSEPFAVNALQSLYTQRIVDVNGQNSY